MDDRLTSPNLESLIQLYSTSKDNQFALFLGSGVNGGEWAVKHPACASWPKLLEEAGLYFHPQHQVDVILQESSDWLQIADKLFEGIDPATVADTFDRVLYSDVFRNPEKRVERGKKHKVLAWKVLKHMLTLCGAISFTAAINDPGKTRSMRRNPKIGCVLTTNYDFFFGAAWPRYTSMTGSWEPVTWRNPYKKLSEGVGPILYLHGYLPYSSEGERDVIINSGDYKRAYPEGGFARRKLSETVKGYHLLFLGFSFKDAHVSDVLMNRKSSKQRYAILREDESDAIDAARSVGVLPVTVRCWSQIPEVLGKIYCAGLSEEEYKRAKKANAQEYWDTLQKGLKPRAKKASHNGTNNRNSGLHALSGGE